MDKIYINGLKIFAYHGVNPEETRDGQEFIVDLCMHTDCSKAGVTDDLNDTVNYAAARKIITAAMTERPFKLIERAATEIADRILQNFSTVEQVDVLLKKPNAPMNCKFDYVAVEISRNRKQVI